MLAGCPAPRVFCTSPPEASHELALTEYISPFRPCGLGEKEVATAARHLRWYNAKRCDRLRRLIYGLQVRTRYNIEPKYQLYCCMYIVT
jgi:hypothetical protein